MFALIFIHSFIQTISIAPLQVHYYSRGAPDTARILCRSFEGLAQGTCMAVRFEPATFLTKGVESTYSTNVPPRPTIRTSDLSDERRRIYIFYKCATTTHDVIMTII